jgi:hypothetical protein
MFPAAPDDGAAFLRSPAEGIWKEEDEVKHDEVVMTQDMAEGLDLD